MVQRYLPIFSFKSNVATFSMAAIKSIVFCDDEKLEIYLKTMRISYFRIRRLRYFHFFKITVFVPVTYTITTLVIVFCDKLNLFMDLRLCHSRANSIQPGRH